MNIFHRAKIFLASIIPPSAKEFKKKNISCTKVRMIKKGWLGLIIISIFIFIFFGVSDGKDVVIPLMILYTVFSFVFIYEGE